MSLKGKQKRFLKEEKEEIKNLKENRGIISKKPK